MKKESRYFFYVGLVFIGVIFGVILTNRFEMQQDSQAYVNKNLIDENFSFPANSGGSDRNSTTDDFSRTFIKINKMVTPSIVSITAVRNFSVKDLEKFHGKGNKDFFDLFRSPNREFRSGASGSGIIVHPEGYILTNTHVVKNATQLEVSLFDNRRFQGHIVGVDSLTEVAVIKIEADDLPVARLGDSNKLQVGQWVVAIGNPLELHFTITAGIISAIGRQMRIIRDNFGIESFIQTDAVINPGNSGGALVDLQGNVIGVNTAIATRSGFYEGYGFAIPINLAKAIMEDLITKGRVVRAYLGISMLPMDYKKAKVYGLDRPAGVFVDNILNDGPAGQAGIQPEDIILAIDGTEVNQANQIQSFIAQKEPGKEVNILLFRQGKKLQIPVVLGERVTSRKRTHFASQKEEEPIGLGLEVKNLNRREAEQLGLKNTGGVMVTGVKPFSKASDANLFISAVIIAVNDVPVDDEKEFWREMDKLKSGEIGKLLVKTATTQTHLFIENP